MGDASGTDPSPTRSALAYSSGAPQPDASNADSSGVCGFNTIRAASLTRHTHDLGDSANAYRTVAADLRRLALVAGLVLPLALPVVQRGVPSELRPHTRRELAVTISPRPHARVAGVPDTEAPATTATVWQIQATEGTGLSQSFSTQIAGHGSMTGQLQTYTPWGSSTGTTMTQDITGNISIGQDGLTDIANAVSASSSAVPKPLSANPSAIRLRRSRWRYRCVRIQRSISSPRCCC